MRCRGWVQPVRSPLTSRGVVGTCFTRAWLTRLISRHRRTELRPAGPQTLLPAGWHPLHLRRYRHRPVSESEGGHSGLGAPTRGCSEGPGHGTSQVVSAAWCPWAKQGPAKCSYWVGWEGGQTSRAEQDRSPPLAPWRELRCVRPRRPRVAGAGGRDRGPAPAPQYSCPAGSGAASAHALQSPSGVGVGGRKDLARRSRPCSRFAPGPPTVLSDFVWTLAKDFI